TAYRGTTAELAAADRSWTYGHIVVDEAQELSAMQWRVLVRRNPLQSFTIVGDVAQSSAAGGATSWASALNPHLGERWRLEELTVNYRTPALITQVAERMALAHGVPITQSRAVRHGELPVKVILGGDPTAHPAALIAEDAAISGRGTIAVIAAAARIDELAISLNALFGAAVGRGAAGLNRTIAVLTPLEAKGLEFDSVVVVEPQEIVDEVARGAANLYVAMTRPTHRLAIVAACALPAGIADPATV
ncbi:MAG: AAA family ATPase, partial [Salinibacterium sp.]|nr:AAA family ATPase [Salinibacterium sp.]